MCEVMNYIFGSLSNSETAIRSIRKSLNKQARYNRKLSTLALIMTVKVVYSGRTLIDLTGDTVTEESLLRGYTAHKADGTLITGTAFDGYPNEFTFLDVLEDSNGHAIQDSSEDVLYGRTVYRKARNNVIFDSYGDIIEDSSIV